MESKLFILRFFRMEGFHGSLRGNDLSFSCAKNDFEKKLIKKKKTTSRNIIWQKIISLSSSFSAR